MRAAPGAWRMVGLLIGLRLKRLFNIMGLAAQFSIGRKKAAAVPGGTTAQVRRGTARRSPVTVVVSAVLVLCMLSGQGMFSFMGFGNLSEWLHVQASPPEPNSLSQAGEKFYWSAEDDTLPKAGEKVGFGTLTRGQFGPELLRAAAGWLTFYLMVVMLMELAARDLAKPEWDMEWLVTLPIATPTLLWARLIERTVANAIGLLVFLPLLSVLAWLMGAPWWLSPFLGLAFAMPLCALSALVRCVADIGLRTRLQPSQCRNIQAVASITGTLGWFLAASLSMPQGGRYAPALVSALPEWAMWAPPGLLVRALNAGAWEQGLGLVLLAFVQVLLLAVLALIWMRRQLRRGLVATGSRERVARSAHVSRPRPYGFTSWVRSPVHRRELKLLARDRNFLVQTLVLPVAIVGFQVAMNAGFEGLAAIWKAPPAFLGSMAFGVGSYLLMLSAFMTIHSEGGALWMLYSFPRSIGSVLKEKAQLWGALALIYPLAILVPGWFIAKEPGWAYLGHSLLALAGVPIYSAIAVALAVFASDPMAANQGARVRPVYSYLYMVLAAFYGYALWAPHWWQSLEIALLSGLLALALWQKAADQLPYLLDPTASPPAKASVADGLIAAMLFLVAQVAIAAIFFDKGPVVEGPALLATFVAAGAVTYGLVRLVYWRNKTQLLPRLLGAASLAQTLRSGATQGIIAAGIGMSYLCVLDALQLMPADAGASGARMLGWVAPLTVLAAPLFEEFIFRGLIFGGLRRSMRLLPAACASAAVFAIVHPPVSVIPVFFLGLCTAFAFERNRNLAAPMLTHAIYNAAIIATQALLLPAA